MEASQSPIDGPLEALAGAGLEAVAKVFEENELDTWVAVDGLTDADLEKLGIALMGSRRKALHCLQGRYSQVMSSVSEPSISPGGSGAPSESPSLPLWPHSTRSMQQQAWSEDRPSSPAVDGAVEQRSTSPNPAHLTTDDGSGVLPLQQDSSPVVDSDSADSLVRTHAWTEPEQGDSSSHNASDSPSAITSPPSDTRAFARSLFELCTADSGGSSVSVTELNQKLAGSQCPDFVEWVENHWAGDKAQITQQELEQAAVGFTRHLISQSPSRDTSPESSQNPQNPQNALEAVANKLLSGQLWDDVKAPRPRRPPSQPHQFEDSMRQPGNLVSEQDGELLYPSGWPAGSPETLEPLPGMEAAPADGRDAIHQMDAMEVQLQRYMQTYADVQPPGEAVDIGTSLVKGRRPKSAPRRRRRRVSAPGPPISRQRQPSRSPPESKPPHLRGGCGTIALEHCSMSAELQAAIAGRGGNRRISPRTAASAKPRMSSNKTGGNKKAPGTKRASSSTRMRPRVLSPPDPWRDTLADPSRRTLRRNASGYSAEVRQGVEPAMDSMETLLSQLQLEACIEPLRRRGVSIQELPYLTYEVLCAVIPTEQGQIRFLQAVSGLAHADHNQLLQRLQDNDAQLTSLGLIRRGIGKAGITRLRSALDSNCYLQILDLSFNSIMDDSSEDLATIICNQATLVSLDLSYNLLSATGAAAIAKGVSKSSTLRRLMLRHNDIGSAGAAQLATVLAGDAATLIPSPLELLDLSENGVAANGLYTIANVLRTNVTLRTLRVGGNKIGSESAAYLAEALSSNISLTHLGLDCNEIDDEGLSALMGHLRGNTALTHVDLQQNRVSDEGVQYAKQQARAGQYPRTIDLRGSLMSSTSGLLFTAFVGADGASMHLTVPSKTTRRRPSKPLVKKPQRWMSTRPYS